MDKSSLDVEQPHSMGTTIIGVTYNGGVVLGADSRTSTGMYVANRASDKITQLTDNVYVCRSGSVCYFCSLSLSLVAYISYFFKKRNCGTAICAVALFVLFSLCFHKGFLLFGSSIGMLSTVDKSNSRN
uniref:Proteasome subunit beta type-6 n=1 Tax=Solanum tuberosum TaxID=4113 RepID=M1BRW0_SOLTU